MKKLIFIFVILFLLSGCTVNYNIKFKSNNLIDEKIEITELNEAIEVDGNNVKDVINGKVYSYSNVFEENDLSYSTVYGNDKLTFTLTSKNKTVQKLTNFNYFKRMFDSAEIVETDYDYSFKTIGKYYQAGLFYDEIGDVGGIFVDKLNINIQFDDEVIENNADKVDESTNTYTWVIDKNTTDKSIEFKLKKDKSKQDNKKESSQKKKKFIYNDLIKILIIICGTIVAITMIIIYAMGLNTKRNKI